MTIRIAIIILFSHYVYGQKNCNVYEVGNYNSIPCKLTGKIIKDTIVVYRPKDCYELDYERKSGIWKIYNNDSILIYIIETKKGKQNGKYIGYFKSGKENMNGFYKGDHFTGYWTEYWPNGQVGHRTYLKKDVWGKREFYNSDGKVIDEEKTFHELWFQCK